MGSLPNLRLLSKDPNKTNQYELAVPEPKIKHVGNVGGKVMIGQPKCATRRSHKSNSQYEVNERLRIFRNPDLDATHPSSSGDNRLSAIQQARLDLLLRNNNGHNRTLAHHRVRHTRSAGSQSNNYCANAALWDDLNDAQMTYSPISSRSSRSNFNMLPNSNVLLSFNQNSSRRRDSLSSSGGASSVRRLIAVVRSTPSRLGPIYSRKLLCRNFAALCLGHATITAALVPLLALQSSVSLWWWPNQSNHRTSDIGSLLLSAAFGVACLSTLFSPFLIHLLGSNWTLVLGYAGTCLFFISHLFTPLSLMIPGYLILGLCLGPLASARISFNVTLANKLTFVMTEEEELYEQDARENILQKLFRGLQAAQDFGMVLGNAVACIFLYYYPSSIQEQEIIQDMFQHDESGDLVCGSQTCPIITSVPSQYEFNNTSWSESLFPCRTCTMIASVFVGCSVMAVALTAVFTDKIRLFVYQDPLERPAGIASFQAVKNAFKDPRLQLAAPLSVFIGLQQGFMLADFSKWYVLCSLSLPNITLVFLSMGILQSIAAFTLSLLLQTVPRYLVIATGFVFHSCLLLVLLTWKPSGDDSALFYVIAAAWGVCNITWETLNFSLLANIYPDTTWQSAFVHGNFFKFLGLSLSFGLHSSICTTIKLYALAISMLLGIAPHTWLEFKLESRKKSKTGLSAL